METGHRQNALKIKQFKVTRMPKILIFYKLGQNLFYLKLKPALKIIKGTKKRKNVEASNLDVIEP